MLLTSRNPSNMVLRTSYLGISSYAYIQGLMFKTRVSIDGQEFILVGTNMFSTSRHLSSMNLKE